MAVLAGSQEVVLNVLGEHRPKLRLSRYPSRLTHIPRYEGWCSSTTCRRRPSGGCLKIVWGSTASPIRSSMTCTRGSFSREEWKRGSPGEKKSNNDELADFLKKKSTAKSRKLSQRSKEILRSIKQEVAVFSRSSRDSPKLIDLIWRLRIIYS